MSRYIGRAGYVLFIVGWLFVITQQQPWWNSLFAPTPLEVIGADQAHSQNLSGKDVVVAVIDEGFDLDHAGLKPNALPFRYNTDDRLPYADTSVIYRNGHYEFQSHGTHVSGIILGNASGKFKGVAPNAKLIPIKVGGRGGEKALVKALNLAQKSTAHIVNISMQLSFSGRWISPDVVQALIDLAQSGKIIVIAAGNESRSMMNNGYLSDLITLAHEPRMKGRMLLVGSIGDKKEPEKLSAFSNYPGLFHAPGTTPYFITAPGFEISSLAPDNQTEVLSGTSMAAPFVAGALALLKEKYPLASSEDLVALLLNHARKTRLGGAEKLNPYYYGAGILDLRSILRR